MRLLKKILGVDKPTATREVSDADAAAVIAAHPVVIAIFWATWCAPCTRFSPVFEEVAAAHRGDAGIGFVAFDVDACPAAARRHAVSSVPTVLAVCDGTEVARTGPLPRAALEQFVERARASRG